MCTYNVSYYRKNMFLFAHLFHFVFYHECKSESMFHWWILSLAQICNMNYDVVMTMFSTVINPLCPMHFLHLSFLKPLLKINISQKSFYFAFCVFYINNDVLQRYKCTSVGAVDLDKCVNENALSKRVQI